MQLNWIKAEEFSFNSFLLMDRWTIRMICKNYRRPEFLESFGIALNHNPAVLWYLVHKCPECKTYIESIAAEAPQGLSPEDVRKAEVFVLQATETAIVYCYPEIMEKNCDYIYNWDKERLFELADFTDKLVLDIGSGTGRLAFAAAERARHVYASEPTDTLREYMRDKIIRENIRNVTVVDGTVQKIPYEDDTFDIVMCGHVIGADYDEEVAELSRVVKNGGYILDCPGDDNFKRTPDEERIARGFEVFYHVSKTGGDIYRYRKRVVKH